VVLIREPTLLPSDVARDVAAQIHGSKRWRAQFMIALRTEYLESYKRHEYVNFQNLLQKRN